MGYTALYRKWRPLVFEDVIGQPHITQTIQNQICSERISHAYLFCGTRGTGKTSTAKIFSRAINCLNNHAGNPCNTCEVCTGILNGSIMDVIEIDAASNNGVDNIREIRDEVVYSPAKGKYKVYIIDEVHMLSTGAFNALLKTLEEPPSHVLFILATTEPHKIPATILSRCQRFDFKRITTDDIISRLNIIVTEDKIDIDEQALRLVAKVSDGSMRDALSVLDQCIAFSNDFISYKNIVSILGIVDHTVFFKMSQGIAEQNIDMLMSLIEQLVMEGRDIIHFMSDLIEHFRNLLMCKVVKEPQHVLDIAAEDIEKLQEHTKQFNQEKIVNCIKVLSEAQSTTKWVYNPRTILEVSIIKLCQKELDTSPESVLDRIAVLEHNLKSGVIEIKANNDSTEKTVSKTKTTPKTSTKKVTSTKKRKIVSSEEVKKAISLWPEVINEVRKSGKLTLFAYLTDTVVKPIDDGIAIVFQNAFATNKMMVGRNDNIKLIEEIIEKLSSTKVKVQCLLERELEEHEQIEEEVHDKLEELINQQPEWGSKMEIYEE